MRPVDSFSTQVPRGPERRNWKFPHLHKLRVVHRLSRQTGLTSSRARPSWVSRVPTHRVANAGQAGERITLQFPLIKSEAFIKQGFATKSIECAEQA
jgi:hypothetical protein